MHVRPAVAIGQFYPASQRELRQTISELLADKWGEPRVGGRCPKVVIAPHAGYIYSGKVAAAAYAPLIPLKNKISRVVVLSPSHHSAKTAISLTAQNYETPLGVVSTDQEAIEQLQTLPYVEYNDIVHGPEHALEVQIPFLQETLGDFKLVPAIVGPVSPSTVGIFLDCLWGDKNTLIVISTDLSHYLPYEKCQTFDQETVRLIEAMDFETLLKDTNRACGIYPLAGLLMLAHRRVLSLETLALYNSGDFSEQRQKVVGYGAFCLYEDEPALKYLQNQGAQIIKNHGNRMLSIARSALYSGLHQKGSLNLDFPNLPFDLQCSGAVFVTLKKKNQLRGCIGSIRAWRPLALDIAYQSYNAGFRDRRFLPLTAKEWDEDLHISVSLLSTPLPFAFQDQKDVVQKMTPGRDGFILLDQGHQGLFLPSVWEDYPDPQHFLNQLKRKADLPENHWSDTLRLMRFTTHVVEGSALDPSENFKK